jgi:hypothetical protein
MPPFPHSEDHIIALPPLLDYPRDHFGRILQVRIHDNHSLSDAMIEACGDRELMAEVARQADQLDALILGP